MKIQGVTSKALTALEADEDSLTGGTFLPGPCAVGISPEVWGQTHRDTIRELENPLKESRVTYTARHLKEKYVEEKNYL